MVDPKKIYPELIRLLDENDVEYKLFSHRPALTYEDLAEVQKEVGFIGKEGKCLVLKVGDEFIAKQEGLSFIVYVTLQGNRVNFDNIKQTLEADKVRLAGPEELKKHFGAEPGCAYPFGFSKDVDIYVDPKIYGVEWFLFSPVLPTKTIQAKGADLKKVFCKLENNVTEIENFNLV